ncbi:MAG: amidohydrolase family protein [Maribacter sp.]
MKNTIYLLIAIVGLMACKPKSDQKSSSETQAVSIDKENIRKIDVHAHFKYSRTYLPVLLKERNMQGVLVDVSIADSAGISRSWDEYLVHAKSNPDLFFLCSSFIGDGIDSPDYAQQTIDRLEKEINSGAQMVKVWKNFGMVTKDAAGNFIQIDDPRLQPIWDFLKNKGIPVIAHIAEPEQAWRPLDDPNNPHYGYYKNNPQYHAFNIPEIPSYETIISARDRWIENNPDLNILCAHLGSMSNHVERVAERLDKYPNMYVETAARFGDLARQDTDKVRAFFDKYKDRIMFGSDYGNSKPQDAMTDGDLNEEKLDLESSYDVLWKYLSSSDSLVVRGQKTAGLGLSADILNKVYYENAVNFLKLQ